MSWDPIVLGEHLRIKHGFPFMGQHFCETGRHVVLTPGNFYETGGFRPRPGKDRFYAVDPPDDFILHPGDLVIAMTEQGDGLLGSSAVIPPNGSYLHNQRIGLVEQLDKKRLDKLFLYHLFNTRYIREKIRASATGGKVRHTAPKRIYEIKVPIPSLREQQRIAECISSYDFLIENNRKRISLLENAAQLSYREWFVHLRFPGHKHVKIADGLPKGWKRFALSELADFVNGYPFKPSELGDKGLPIVKIPELKLGVTSKTPRNSGETIPERYHLGDGDLIFSWSGTLAVNIWTGGKALLNQHLFRVLPTERVSAAFMLLTLREMLKAFDNHTVGATMKHIRRSALDRVFVALPDRTSLSVAESYFQSIHRQLITLSQQNQKIAQARDLLLPRLMTGEITI